MKKLLKSAVLLAVSSLSFSAMAGSWNQQDYFHEDGGVFLSMSGTTASISSTGKSSYLFEGELERQGTLGNSFILRRPFVDGVVNCYEFLISVDVGEGSIGPNQVSVEFIPNTEASLCRNPETAPTDMGYAQAVVAGTYDRY